MRTFEQECPHLSAVSDSSVPLQGPGRIHLSEHGRLIVSVEFPSATPLIGLPAGVYEISGSDDQGAAVFAEGAYVEATSCDIDSRTATVSFSPMRCTLKSAKCQTAEWTHKKLWLKNVTGLGRTQWTDDGDSLELPHLSIPKEVPEHERPGLINAEFEVRPTAATTEPFDERRTAYLDLLGLASRCPCAAPLEETWHGDEWLETVLVPNEWNFRPTHPLIPFDAVESFLTQTSAPFQRKDADYGLHVLAAYYCRSHTETMAEFKFIFAGVLMETLKFNWALNVKKLPTQKTSTGMVRAFTDANGKFLSFQKLIDMTSADLGIAASYTFIENRNALFHTGQTAAAQQAPAGATGTWAALKPELVKLHDQIDDLLLTILEYQGPISSYWAADTKVMFPGRTLMP